MATITISGGSYNSYEDLAGANTYLAARVGIGTLWTALSTTVKNQALVSATRWINNFLTRQLSAADVPDPSVDPAPTEIQEATAELAFALSQDSTLLDKSRATSSNRKRVKAGSVELENFRAEDGTVFPTQVQHLLSEWMKAAGLSPSGESLLKVAGTGCPSEFSDLNKYGKSEGYA